MRYVIALGANMRHHAHGAPSGVVHAAARTLGVVAMAPVMRSRPIGPSLRDYANTVALVNSTLSPPDMLAHLKRIERAFGRRNARRWGSRVIDLDIVLWSGGRWRSARLTVPHASYRERDFVLRPLMALVPNWRDPVTGFKPAQLFKRLTKPRPALRGARLDRAD